LRWPNPSSWLRRRPHPSSGAGFRGKRDNSQWQKSAAAGGYTAICSMANTHPVSDTKGLVEEVYELGVAAGYVDVQPVGAVTGGLEGKELASISEMAKSKAQVKMFSDDGACVFDPVLMEQGLLEVKKFGGVIAQHAQDPDLTKGPR
jgi:Dihydroorotase and related cyclic amidohydrolases